MAVFPDRLVLKNSSDSQAQIIAAIQEGGADEINQGEIVLGLTPGQTKIYTKDAAGTIVSLGGADVAPLYIGDLLDVDTTTDPPLVGESLQWDGTNWVPANISLNDLSDVTYLSGSLDIQNLDKIEFTSTEVPANETYKLFANQTLGLGLGSYRTVDSRGSFVFVNRNKGIELRSEISGIVRLSGHPNESDNQPELRWESGNATGSITGSHIGLKLPADISVSQTYILPALDGEEGQVLSTDGSGVLSWVDGGIGGGGSGGLVFWGGGNFTTGASDGEPPDGGLFTTLP